MALAYPVIISQSATAPSPRLQPGAGRSRHQEEADLDEQLRARGCRGVTHGYARSPVDQSKAVVVGCNYPESKQLRLWGAGADAHAWSSVLCGHLGVPQKNLLLLCDETEEGKRVPVSDSTFPSQRNLLEALRWLVADAQPGDQLTFVFCGHGSLVLDRPDDVNLEPEEDDSERTCEAGLLCGDYSNTDWIRGYSMRLITSEMLTELWASLPRGTSLTLIIDAAYGTQMLPVVRRLDPGRLSPEELFEGEPTPMLDPLVFGVHCTMADAKEELQRLQGLSWEESTSSHAERAANGLWPQKRWLRGGMLWDVAVSVGRGGEPAGMDAEVQAFALCSGSYCSPSYEAQVTPAILRGNTGDQNWICQSMVSGADLLGSRRGVLTRCLIQAMEEMNYQGAYYELWWKSMHIARREGFRDQNFQLTFSDMADPTSREVFSPVGTAEAQAYLKRSELETVWGPEAYEHNNSGTVCTLMGSCEDHGSHTFDEHQDREVLTLKQGGTVGGCGCGHAGAGCSTI